MTVAEPQPTPAGPPAPPFQFRLRTLFLLTTLCAASLSLFRWLSGKYGLEIAGWVMLVAIATSFHAACALWMVSDARKRGKSSILLVALFAYFGPFAVIPWFFLRPRVKAIAFSTNIEARTERDRRE